MEQSSGQDRRQDLQLGKWLAGAAVGAAIMYMLDPERGRQRRTRSGKKLRQLGRQGSTVLEKVTGELGNRLSHASDAVREAASRAGSMAQGLASQTLERGSSGSSNQRDTGGTQSWTQGMDSGTGGTQSWTQGMDSGTGSSGNGQDGMRRDGIAGAGMQPVQNMLQRMSGDSSGSGGVRGASLAGGAALSLYGLVSRRSPLALAAGLAGVALLARGTGRRTMSNVLAAASPGRPVVVEKTIRIDASPEHVFDLFAHYENFPRYMSNVIEVRDLGERRSHWVVRGPAGTHFQWNAFLTEHSRPRRLAWESEPGAEVQQTGSILFEPFRSGTRVTVHMSYRPPAGAVGHAIASLLGSDPKRQMGEDLARMKTLVERGAMNQVSAGAADIGSTFLH